MKFNFHNALNQIYLIVFDGNDAKEIYLPMPATVDINLIQMEVIRKSIISEQQNFNFNDADFNLAIVDPNTTIIYYKLVQGFIDFDSTKHQKVNHS